MPPLSLRSARKNQNGQVAIFVALIFQIIFVLFAMVINVGLLVHHKINLQQSTDLAAYYGAMKQAEMLNVISHMNFQIRQSWKLMAWRYRTLGIFGYEAADGVTPGFMIGRQGTSTTLTFDFVQATKKCPTTGGDVGIADVSPYCIAHVGYGDWAASGTSAENNCKANCTQVTAGLNSIPKIPPLTVTHTVPGAGVSGAIQTLISTANAQGQSLCRKMSFAGLAQISNILASYFIDVDNRKQAAELLMGNLLLGADKMIDIDGGLVKDGVFKTLKNNLTEANRTSLEETPGSYKFMNSTSDDNPAVGGCDSRKAAFNDLRFQVVNLLLMVCDPAASPNTIQAKIFENIYLPAYPQLNPRYQNILTADPGIAFDLNNIQNIIQNYYEIGYEKNPWCSNYFGVRAKTEPRIPFLPLARITLHATSFAKPFGGTIGPWFYDKWPSTSEKSSSAGKQTDQNLPPLTFGGAPPNFLGLLKTLPNYSNYIGDKEGLRDPMYQAIYHDFLLSRSLNRSTTSDASRSQVLATPSPATFSKSPMGYPFYANWRNISKVVGDIDHDPLALDAASVRNSHIRDMEISAIAPNQFDLAYYSIDPDFYNNYYKNRLDNNGTGRTLDKLKSAVGGFGNLVIRPDYGYNRQLASSNAIAEDYSVRHQLSVVEEIFKGDANMSARSQMQTPGLSAAMSVVDKYFTFIPRFQGTLLTGWTYKDLVSQDGFTEFPTASTGTKMPFGICTDPFPSSGTPSYDSLTKLNAPTGGGRLPAAAGNCITGGRTGYSVKIVSPNAINLPQGEIGGTGTAGGLIRNRIPEDFFEWR